MDFERDEPPAAPSQAALEEMRRHLEEEHGIEFELERDLSWAGNVRADAVLTHRAPTHGAAEAFWCTNCGGAVFLVALEPELSQERIAYLTRRNPRLEEALAGVAEEDRAEVVEAFQAEASGDALLARHRRRARQRTTEPQPAAQERRERAQRYLLDRYEELGNVEEALWALAQLRRRDPKAYRMVMGDEHDYKIETLRKYWQDIPLTEREAAKQRYRARAESL